MMVQPDEASDASHSMTSSPGGRLLPEPRLGLFQATEPGGLQRV